jgi:hypothetical protein
MSQRDVERTIGKLVTDQGFCEDFFRDPVRARLRIGVDLTQEETSALLRIPRAAIAYLCERLDDRICKLHIIRETIRPERRQ